MFEFASNDIVSYLQSDMVISKNYDLALLKHIKPQTVLSSTRIEPPLHGVGSEKHTIDFGIIPQEFKYNEFLEFCDGCFHCNVVRSISNLRMQSSIRGIRLRVWP